MKAVVFAGPGAVAVEDVPEPRPVEADDAVVAVNTTAICGSDLHLLDGKTPGMRPGSVIGHEFVGTVVAAGSGATSFTEGQRVLGSFLIACGRCPHCSAGRYNFCLERRALGMGSLSGDLDGAQAEAVRVPHAATNLLPMDAELETLDDEQVLFCGDILATGFYAAALSEIGADDTVLVIGAGPVGLFCAAGARRTGARVLVADSDADRARFAGDQMGFETVAAGADLPDAVLAATSGAGADIALDAVGAVPVVKLATRCVRDGGRVTVVGVYGAERYELPMGRMWVRGLDIRFSGMANVQAHWRDCAAAVAVGELDPTKVITHRIALDDAPRGYELFRARRALKVVMTP
ncbi:MAG TPA: alcohol dehydrogenase catalytic domain-containing protein [Actinomycetota bacterium]|nr:alcohol dehydrogenase catalytic domain-containing protein [Actinomycetota bacterium]